MKPIATAGRQRHFSRTPHSVTSPWSWGGPVSPDIAYSSPFFHTGLEGSDFGATALQLIKGSIANLQGHDAEREEREKYGIRGYGARLEQSMATYV